MEHAIGSIEPGIYEVKFSKFTPGVKVQVYKNLPSANKQTIKFGIFQLEMNEYFRRAKWRKCS